jgi:hypothetical protein
MATEAGKTRTDGDEFEAFFNSLDSGAPAAKAEDGEFDDASKEAGEAEQPEQEQQVAEQQEESSADDDWLDALPEDVRARVEAMRQAEQESQELRTRLERKEHDYQALQGRLAPIQRKLATLEAQRTEASPAASPAQQATPQAQQADPIFGSDAWTKWASEFPEDAKVMESTMRAIQQQADSRVSRLEQMIQTQIQPSLSAAAETAHRVEAERQRQELAAEHPDWTELNASGEFWAWFDGYRESMPPHVAPALHDEQQLRGVLSDARFVSNLLHQYKRDRALVDMSERSTPNVNGGGSSVRQRMAQAPAARSTGIPVSGRRGQATSDGELFERLLNDPNFR